MVERDPRQWYSYGYQAPAGVSYGLSSGLETVLIGLLVFLTLGIIGLPLLLLSISYIGSSFPGSYNFIPPTTTTTVNGKRKRDLFQSKLFRNENPFLQNKLMEIFQQFLRSSDKINFMGKLTQSFNLRKSLFNN